jgi:DNA-binding FadR family transcriptional regulator
MVEPDCARLAAERATPEELSAIETALHIMEENAGDPSLTSQADLDFHLAIATATHNPLISAIVDPIIAPLYRTISASHAYPALIQLSLEGHRPVLAAIRSRDPERAYQAMLRHLAQGVREDVRIQIRPVE